MHLYAVRLKEEKAILIDGGFIDIGDVMVLTRADLIVNADCEEVALAKARAIEEREPIEMDCE
jgi:hypothetical protein